MNYEEAMSYNGYVGFEEEEDKERYILVNSGTARGHAIGHGGCFRKAGTFATEEDQKTAKGTYHGFKTMKALFNWVLGKENKKKKPPYYEKAVWESIQHWKRMIKWAEGQDPDNDFDTEDMPEGPNGKSCALCKKYNKNLGCGNCPLAKAGHGCRRDESVFNKAAFARYTGDFVTNAKKMLKVLKSLKQGFHWKLNKKGLKLFNVPFEVMENTEVSFDFSYTGIYLFIAKAIDCFNTSKIDQKPDILFLNSDLFVPRKDLVMSDENIKKLLKALRRKSDELKNKLDK